LFIENCTSLTFESLSGFFIYDHISLKVKIVLEVLEAVTNTFFKGNTILKVQLLVASNLPIHKLMLLVIGSERFCYLGFCNSINYLYIFNVF
jgi:hypothetical protein